MNYEVPNTEWNDRKERFIAIFKEKIHRDHKER